MSIHNALFGIRAAKSFLELMAEMIEASLPDSSCTDVPIHPLWSNRGLCRRACQAESSRPGWIPPVNNNNNNRVHQPVKEAFSYEFGCYEFLVYTLIFHLLGNCFFKCVSERILLLRNIDLSSYCSVWLAFPRRLLYGYLIRISNKAVNTTAPVVG